MLQGPVAPANRGGMPDGPIEVVARLGDGLTIVETQRQIRRNRRRERAPGAVCVRRGDARLAQLEGPVARARNVDGLGPVQMAALDEYDAGSQAEDPFACGVHRVDGAD